MKTSNNTLKNRTHNTAKSTKSVISKACFVLILIIMVSTSAFAQLAQSWSSRYNGTANNDDRLTISSTKMDAGGNLYVAGWSAGVNTSYDYILLKYNSSGILLWSARYTGIGGNTDDYAYGMALDNSDNIYVTGKSNGGGSSYDVATLKYNSSGQLQWVQRYNGADNGPDWANCITIDPSGNVIVAGRSEVTGSGTNSNYLTIKYSPSGVMQWVRGYNGPGDVDDDRINSIASDASGNIYVTGRSGWDNGADYDMATIKYNSAGAQQFVVHYNGSSSADDEGKVVVTDAAGNFYVTGVTAETGFNYNITTIKYNSSGVQQWIKPYNGITNGSDAPYDMKIDASGNIYVVGTSAGNGTNTDYVTIKLNNSGTQLWASRYNGPGNGPDTAKSVAVDDAGNVYVTGSSAGNGTNYDFATVKYSSAGVQLGNIMRYDGPAGNGYDGAVSVVCNGAGSTVYVTGFSAGSGTVYDIATVKYSQPTGVIQNNSQLPDNYSLSQNYPNPFNPSTMINFDVRESGIVKIAVYDITGREAAVLVNEEMQPGSYKVDFNAGKLSSGVYFYKLITAGFTDTKKMILTK